MNDLQIQRGMPSQGFTPRYEAEALSAELAKMLGLVAPVTMSADQQAVWLVSAVDALRDIRSAEVAEVSIQVRRTVTRPSQIVPEIAKLVAENRARQSERRRRDAENEQWRTAIPARKHISERDQSKFTAADWDEFNEWLEKQGATARYRHDGTRYFVNTQ